MSFIDSILIKIKSAKSDEELKQIIANIIVASAIDTSIQNEGSSYTN
jgi:hypothetical protein